MEDAEKEGERREDIGLLRIGAAGGGRRTAGRAQARWPRRTEGKERKREGGRNQGSERARRLLALSLPLSREMVDGPRSSRRGLSAWDAVLKIATKTTIFACHVKDCYSHMYFSIHRCSRSNSLPHHMHHFNISINPCKNSLGLSQQPANEG